MSMHADMTAALRAGWPIVHLVTVTLPGHTIRWTDAGFVKWGDDTWTARDETYGTLDEIGDITDGIDDDRSNSVGLSDSEFISGKYANKRHQQSGVLRCLRMLGSTQSGWRCASLAISSAKRSAGQRCLARLALTCTAIRSRVRANAPG